MAAFVEEEDGNLAKDNEKRPDDYIDRQIILLKIPSVNINQSLLNERHLQVPDQTYGLKEIVDIGVTKATSGVQIKDELNHKQMKYLNSNDINGAAAATATANRRLAKAEQMMSSPGGKRHRKHAAGVRHGLREPSVAWKDIPSRKTLDDNTYYQELVNDVAMAQASELYNNNRMEGENEISFEHAAGIDGAKGVIPSSDNKPPVDRQVLDLVVKLLALKASADKEVMANETEDDAGAVAAKNAKYMAAKESLLADRKEMAVQKVAPVWGDIEKDVDLKKEWDLINKFKKGDIITYYSFIPVNYVWNKFNSINEIGTNMPGGRIPEEMIGLGMAQTPPAEKELRDKNDIPFNPVVYKGIRPFKNTEIVELLTTQINKHYNTYAKMAVENKANQYYLMFVVKRLPENNGDDSDEAKKLRSERRFLVAEATKKALGNMTNINDAAAISGDAPDAASNANDGSADDEGAPLATVAEENNDLPPTTEEEPAVKEPPAAEPPPDEDQTPKTKSDQESDGNKKCVYHLTPGVAHEQKKHGMLYKICGPTPEQRQTIVDADYKKYQAEVIDQENRRQNYKLRTNDPTRRAADEAATRLQAAQRGKKDRAEPALAEGGGKRSRKRLRKKRKVTKKKRRRSRKTKKKQKKSRPKKRAYTRKR